MKDAALSPYGVRLDQTCATRTNEFVRATLLDLHFQAKLERGRFYCIIIIMKTSYFDVGGGAGGMEAVRDLRRNCPMIKRRRRTLWKTFFAIPTGVNWTRGRDVGGIRPRFAARTGLTEDGVAN